MLKDIVQKCEDLREEFTEDFKSMYSGEELERQVLSEIQDELEFPLLAHLSAEEQLQLVREYNGTEKPTAVENLIIASLNTDQQHKLQRIFNNEESHEIMSAYAKCAVSSDAMLPVLKQSLAKNMKALLSAHPETAKTALRLYDEQFCDIDIIDNVRACMTSDLRLMDKGFAVIHKNVQNLMSGNDDAAKSAVSERLATAFRDLYGKYGSQNYINLDKITENFILHGKYIDRESQVGMQHTLLYCDSPDKLCQAKNEILYECFKKMEIDGRTFGEIYAQELGQNNETLAQLEQTAKVFTKIRKNSDNKKADRAVMPNSLRYNLIHAGPEKPTAENFRKVSNGRGNIYHETVYDKPTGGLWSSLASKNDDDVGQWMEFCQRDYKAWIDRKYKGSWHVVPNDDCRILEFNNLSDIRPYLFDIEHPHRPCSDEEIWSGLTEFSKTGKRRICVDYVAISKDYDLFVIKNQYGDHPLFGDLDCDSALITDIKKVKFVDNEDYAKLIKDETRRFGEQLKDSDVDVMSFKKEGNVKLNKRVMQAKFFERLTDLHKR